MTAIPRLHQQQHLQAEQPQSSSRRPGRCFFMKQRVTQRAARQFITAYACNIAITMCLIHWICCMHWQKHAAIAWSNKMPAYTFRTWVQSCNTDWWHMAFASDVCSRAWSLGCMMWGFCWYCFQKQKVCLDRIKWVMQAPASASAPSKSGPQWRQPHNSQSAPPRSSADCTPATWSRMPTNQHTASQQSPQRENRKWIETTSIEELMLAMLMNVNDESKLRPWVAECLGAGIHIGVKDEDELALEELVAIIVEVPGEPTYGRPNQSAQQERSAQLL